MTDGRDVSAIKTSGRQDGSSQFKRFQLYGAARSDTRGAHGPHTLCREGDKKNGDGIILIRVYIYIRSTCARNNGGGGFCTARDRILFPGAKRLNATVVT